MTPDCVTTESRAGLRPLNYGKECMRMFKWHVRWTRLVIALSSIAAFVIASGAGRRWS